MEHIKEYIKEELLASVQTKENFIRENMGHLIKAIELMTQVTLNGGKIIYFGNGGSAADSQHLAAEHVFPGIDGKSGKFLLLNGKILYAGKEVGELKTKLVFITEERNKIADAAVLAHDRISLAGRAHGP